MHPTFQLVKRHCSPRDFQLSLLGVLLLWPLATWSSGTADLNAIVQRWIETNDRDLEAAPHYNYFERIRDDSGTKTYEVTMLFGSPYKRLVKQNGKPLSDEGCQQQEDAFEQTLRDREAKQSIRRHHVAVFSIVDRARRLPTRTAWVSHSRRGQLNCCTSA
jgi:hypothetical protein